MRRIPPWLLTAALVAVPLALSFVPGVPPHGYGHVLLLAPVVSALRHPERRRRLLLYGAGLLLLLLAYPDPDLGFLGWVLLWPYLLARERDDGAPWLRSAFLFGFFRAFVGFHWLGHVHYTAWLGVSLAAGFAFAVAFEWPLRRLTFVPYALRVAALWLLFEWIHSWLLGGFPWLFLSHTQYRFLTLIQVADVVGAFGVSFLVAFVSAAVLEAIRRRRAGASLLAAFLLFLSALLYGAIRGGPGGADGPGILMVQTAVPSLVKEEEIENPRGELAAALVRLTRDGLAEHPDAALVVWPETMVTDPFIEDEPERSTFTPPARARARRFGKPFVYGISSFATIERFKLRRGYNTAILVDAKGRVQGLYRKQRLVPMGEEFLPRRILPEAWADGMFLWLSSNLGLPRTCDLESGGGYATLDAGPGLRCATLICFEGVYPDLARGAARHGQPDLMLHLVNNGWFVSPRFLGGHIPSFEQRQCLAAWVFRAVETRMPFFSCANAGITCAVAPDGRILSRVDRVMGEGWLYERVPARWPMPLFLRGGFLLPPVLLLLLLPVLLWRARKRA
ncbi:MAG TPA: apolipoprotein N-acyltransferase [Planctomycetota bacterium]|nr:apolipoprotein N-acyltransferase [Planctomycetota bacterium]